MKILGIETSCDETAIAILEIEGKKNPRFRILSNVMASQAKLHAKYGGVYPSLARREHQKNLPIVLNKALISKVDAIAITVGPGLDPCLWTGIEFAKDLANKWKVPLVPVDHMEGHLLVGLFLQGNEKSTLSSDRVPRRMTGQIPNPKIFPAIALLVSGGHTQLVLIKGVRKYKVIGETRDDAAGECFDKTARILRLPYPGGPAIAAQAAKIRNPKFEIRNKFKIKLPRPMMHTKDYDFSFSGLKTAVLYDYQSRPKRIQKSQEYIVAMAKEIQQAIVDVLIAKTLRAALEYNAKCVILGGGVAANSELRRQLKSAPSFDGAPHRMMGRSTKSETQLLIAPPELCTDNGLMPALAGFFNLSKKKRGEALNRIAAQPNLRLK